MSVAYGETGLEVRHIVVKRTIIEIFNLTSVFDFCLEACSWTMSLTGRNIIAFSGTPPLSNFFAML